MRRITLALFVLAALCASAAAQTQEQQQQGAVSEEKRRDIVRLLELTRAADIGTQLIQQMMGTLRSGFTMLPAETREKVLKTFEEEMSKEFSRERMIESAVPIYDKYLSAEDVKGLIAFYETPLGRRTIEAMPSISREAYEDGARRGREAGLRVMAKIASEGVLNPTEPPPAPRPKPRRPTRRPRG